MDKSSIRKAKLDERRAMDEVRHRELSAQIIAKLKPYLQGVIALYHPVLGEVDIASLLTPDSCLPVMVKNSKQMIFRKNSEGNIFKKNAHGIMEPAETAELCEPDVIIVPMLAFDQRGYRVGYGGGYYDTTLAMLRQHKKITAIGVAFSFQEIANIPEQAFDVKLDKVITEKETLEFA